MANVTLERVRKVYDNGFVAVHGASFEVRDGEFVVLVGPSGCGKSTMLRMIAGLESITEGVLRIGDRVVNDVPPKDRDIAMVFQNYALYPHMTAFENMAFGLRLRKFPKAEIRKRVEQAAEILGLMAVLDRKPAQLSGGQRQRVAVGRAIVRQPRVFLFDEPLSNLDAKLRVQMRTEIARLHRRLGATMIYVTHDQVEAMTMGDRIVVLRDGHIQQIDTPLALYNRPANRFVAGFIGSPSMNFVPGRVVREGGLRFQARDGRFALPLDEERARLLRAYVGQPVTLGIRPEDLHVAGSRYVTGPVAEAAFPVEVLEPMGNEIFVYARAGEQTLVARVPPQPLPGPGEPVRLAFDLARLHFFDAETEEAIGFQVAVAA
ncbi:sn-glycerol-3-phosphate ABC transporter ATP-binding protein UgpC [Rhodocaloribacter litoris]|uniref:ABC transporter ATP-binding protein n=1 Tax=Rhodocaloribacter litoris TaxID=2558931 RepID=UPI00141E09BB|nr:sn-glycerol-3-phosphate ABC transporter ATP-binding protein UgpC [Rhodocaloribacter litoris]QXD15323.1 sn-glycerol-3-phosphate ABC transporter ATP-binding protein UgpC [Rhodocaloribacter litoris]